MSEIYFDLKKQLEELGYNNYLPADATSLVECILADLLQTTRSLQYYMELAKEAIQQRDCLSVEVEPYKCDNAKLVQENIALSKQLMHLKEDHQKLLRESKHKIQALCNDICNKDLQINKLQFQCRDLGLRGLCADTLSSRNKIKNKLIQDIKSQQCEGCCNHNSSISHLESHIVELKNQLKFLEDRNTSYADEVCFLKNQVDNRNDEILRLTILLEGGRPYAALKEDCCSKNLNTNTDGLSKEIEEMEDVNKTLKKQLQESLGSKHEAMERAVNLAEKNRRLEEELMRVDKLALKVEEECNKQMATKADEIETLQNKIEYLLKKISQLENEVSKKPISSLERLGANMTEIQELQQALNNAMKEKDSFYREIKLLQNLNKSLEEKLSTALSQGLYNMNLEKANVNNDFFTNYATKDDLKDFIEKERSTYEGHVAIIQKKLTDAIEHFNKNYMVSKDTSKTVAENTFIKDLHNKICECEHKLLQVMNENENLRKKIENYKIDNSNELAEKVAQLNAENSELAKENISLSSLLNKFKRSNAENSDVQSETLRSSLEKISKERTKITEINHILQKDKQEYMLRYKEAMDQIDSLKRDLAIKQSQFEQLQEENCSYKISRRSGLASADHLKEECAFLREQIKKMQNDVIKEKTLTNQMRNLQIETERSTSDIQNELLNVQKQLSITKNNYSILMKKYEEQQSEMMSLKISKTNLIENIKKIDQERDKLVIEIDNKTEALFSLEKKFNSKLYEVEKLEAELREMKRKLTLNVISEHKLSDFETKIQYLNEEIHRITQQYDNSLIENKRLQDSLANMTSALKVSKIEHEKSRKEVDGLRLQLQHYVTEVKRIEDLLSHKEAERADMLEHFASLSVEANILENTNHSLENETASKSIQLQTSISRLQELETKLLDKDNVIDSQSAQIAAMHCKLSSRENEIRLIVEEKSILQKNISYLKELCQKLESEKKDIVQGVSNTDSELQLYENKIQKLSDAKRKLEMENNKITSENQSIEKLLSVARREVVELKLALQDATSETKVLKEELKTLRGNMTSIQEVETEYNREIDLSHALEIDEALSERRHEEFQESLHSRDLFEKRSSKYSHGGTL